MFATACSGAEDTAVNLASLVAAGWEKLPADADTPVTRLSRDGMAAMKERAEAEGNPVPEALSGAEFRRTVAGRQLYVSVSGIRDGAFTARGCRLYDFTAPRALSADELQDWSVRDPADINTAPEGLQKAIYNPGLKPGHMAMEIFFIPPGTAMPMGIELSGISLVATAVEQAPKP
jgi:hypothetical protein